MEIIEKKCNCGSLMALDVYGDWVCMGGCTKE